MWQELYLELQARNFTIISIAFDSREGAAQPWVEKARPDYLTLVDPFHHVAELYNMVNVNQAVWIDEHGRIVRPTESAGVTEGFRHMDRQTGAMPESVTTAAAQIKSVYHTALRDWVAKGAASNYAPDPQQVKRQLQLPTDNIVKAHTAFVLGQYLLATGNTDEGDALVATASELHPESWAIWRQGAELDERGLAATSDFWDRVDALGSRKYYASIDMPGMPDNRESVR